MIERRWIAYQGNPTAGQQAGLTNIDVLASMGGERIWWCEKVKWQAREGHCATDGGHDECGYRWLVKP